MFNTAGKVEFFRISEEVKAVAHGSAWSIENMEAHGAAGRQVEYIGSEVCGNLIYDYYIDSNGEYWYKNRAIVDNQIVSMEMYLFGKEIRNRSRSCQ